MFTKVEGNDVVAKVYVKQNPVKKKEGKVRELKGKKGFTLIELLVVVAIIAILAAIAIPQYAKYRERAAKASAMSDARNVATNLEAYYADTQNYPDSIALSDSVLTFGNDQTFSLSKNNTIKGYGAIGGSAYTYTIFNTVYNKSIVYDSREGGIDESTSWK